MAQKAVDETTAEVMAGTKKRLDDLAGVQSEFFGKWQRRWLDRIAAETKLTSEMTAKLTAARSIPDAAAVCQEWTTRRIELMVEDSRQFWDDAQKFVQSGAKGLGVST